MHSEQLRCLADDRDSLRVYLRFPRKHWTRARYSNFIERSFGETLRRAKVIGRLPGERACVSLISAVCDRVLTVLRHALHDPPTQLP